MLCLPVSTAPGPFGDAGVRVEGPRLPPYSGPGHPGMHMDTPPRMHMDAPPRMHMDTPRMPFPQGMAMPPGQGQTTLPAVNADNSFILIIIIIIINYNGNLARPTSAEPKALTKTTLHKTLTTAATIFTINTIAMLTFTNNPYLTIDVYIQGKVTISTKSLSFPLLSDAY